MKNKSEVDNQRRQALKALGGSVVAGTVVATVAGTAQASTQAVDVPSKESKAPKGYHETQHIRDYYDSL
jgi:hypothetical protein